MLIVSLKRNHQLEIILKSALESDGRVDGTYPHPRNASVRKTIYSQENKTTEFKVVKLIKPSVSSPKPPAKSPVSSKQLRLNSKILKSRQKQLGIAPKKATINLNDSNAIFNDFSYKGN